MVDGEDGWVRLLILLSERVWDRKRAVFIIAGLDPATIWPANEFIHTRLVWLPGGLRPEWEGMTPDQVERRAAGALTTAGLILHGLPSPMTPYAWLSEAMRDGYVPARRILRADRENLEGQNVREPGYTRPGVTPPWYERARARKGLKHFLPPDPRANITARARKWDALKSRIRQRWEAWRFDETDYGSEGQFIRQALEAEKAACPDRKLVQQWMMDWRREARLAYGEMPQDLTASGDRSRRGYGHPALVEPVKPGRPKK